MRSRDSRPSLRSQREALCLVRLQEGERVRGKFTEEAMAQEFRARYQASPIALGFLTLNPPFGPPEVQAHFEYEAACFVYWLEQGLVEPYAASPRPDVAAFRMTRKGRLRISTWKKLNGMTPLEREAWDELGNNVRD